MHSEPMKTSDGTFAKGVDSDHPCPKCRASPVKRRDWESNCGGYEDEQYRCPACGHVWWVEGIDS